MKKLDQPLTLDREPLAPGLDPHDASVARGTMLAIVGGRFQQLGHLPATILALTDAHCIVVDIQGRFDIGEEQLGAATLEAMAGWPEVVRAYRVGESLIFEPDGSSRRVIGVVELHPETGAWWLAWCHVGQGGAGVGVLHGDSWTGQEGIGPEAAPEAFREWIDSEDVVLHLDQPEWEAKQPDVDVQCAFVPLGEDVPPDDLGELVRWLERRIYGDLIQRGVGHLGVLVLRRDTLEQWELRGTLPCGFDDAARNIAAFGDGVPLAVGMARVGPVTLDGAPTRALVITVERAGHRAERMLPLVIAADGLVSMPRSYGPKLLGAVREGDGWIGVEPGFVFEPYLLGAWGSGMAEG